MAGSWSTTASVWGAVSNRLSGAAAPSPSFVPKTGFPSFIAGPGFGSAALEVVFDPATFPRFLSRSFFFSSSTAFTAALCVASISARFEPSLTGTCVFAQLTGEVPVQFVGGSSHCGGVHSAFSPASSFSRFGIIHPHRRVIDRASVNIRCALREWASIHETSFSSSSESCIRPNSISQPSGEVPEIRNSLLLGQFGKGLSGIHAALEVRQRPLAKPPLNARARNNAWASEPNRPSS
jgi:hypothetical protein